MQPKPIAMGLVAILEAAEWLIYHKVDKPMPMTRIRSSFYLADAIWKKEMNGCSISSKIMIHFNSVQLMTTIILLSPTQALSGADHSLSAAA